MGLELNINITKATVVLTEGTDNVYLHTDLPEPFMYEGNCRFAFSVTHNKGVDYVRTHFGIEPEIVNDRKDKVV